MRRLPHAGVANIFDSGSRGRRRSLQQQQAAGVEGTPLDAPPGWELPVTPAPGSAAQHAMDSGDTELASPDSDNRAVACVLDGTVTH